MKRNNLNIECARFIAAILVMTHHSYHLGIEKYPFLDCWIYVEFFLMITGYYTAKHFSNISVSDKFYEALYYSKEKSKSFLPLVLLVTMAAWLTQVLIGLIFSNWTVKEAIKSFMGNFVFDILNISVTYTIPLVAPLWYIYLLVLIFPAFCLVTMIPNKSLRLYLALIFPILYYAKVGVVSVIVFPYNTFRMFAGLLLGVSIYDLSMIIGWRIQKIKSGILTMAEFAAFLYPIVCGFCNLATREVTSFRVYVLCFYVYLLLALSGYSCTSNMKSKLWKYLGRLSFPVFIIHWYIATLVEGVGRLFNMGNIIKICLYYSMTIVISAVVLRILERKYLRKISRRLLLSSVDE